MAGAAGRSTGGRGAASYDRFKEWQGQRYTGMQVGRRHRWRYDAGEWTEKKVTPDEWEFTYAVTKRRAGKAPEGSGAPVGTAYRWYILASQVVTKQDANSYTTEMAGLKYKLAHRRADKDSWSASEAAQRRRLAQVLRQLIAELEAPPAETSSAATRPLTTPTTRNGTNGKTADHASRTKANGKSADHASRSRARGKDAGHANGNKAPTTRRRSANGRAATTAKRTTREKRHAA
jgi:hypothetical protein